MSSRALPRARRSLGQNFLINNGVRDKIVDALAPTRDQWVVEIGPGPGALTGALCARCAHVVAVELDRELAEALPNVVEHPERLDVRVADAARVDYAGLALEAPGPLLVVGNLPFNAAAAILRRALVRPEQVQRLVLMFQREVAQRICAAPGTKDQGLLTVVTQQRARVKRLFDVAPGSFRPAPRVSAAVVRLEPVARLGACCLRVHDALVKAAFSRRRKTLRNSLRAGAPWPWELVLGAAEEAGIPLRDRAEEIPVDRWAALARALCRARGGCGE